MVTIKHDKLKIPVPFCKHCAEQQVAATRLGWFLIGCAIAVAVGLSLYFELGKFAGCFVASVLVVPGAWVLECYKKTVRVDGQPRAVTFSFTHREYAEEFQRLNDRKADSANA